MKPTPKEVIAELERELRMRDYVYPKQVGSNKMTQEQADHRCNCLREAIYQLTQISYEKGVGRWD